MKSPDEIKKGLEYLSVKEIVKKLDLWKEGIAYDYAEDAATDALAYIQQIERERDALLEIVRNEADCKVCKYLKEECNGDCSFCEIEGPCACARCTTEDSHWEYAGIKEDNP